MLILALSYILLSSDRFSFFNSFSSCLWVSVPHMVSCVCVQEEYYGMPLILADRDLVEQGADEILKDADVTDVAFLVVGDPFG